MANKEKNESKDSRLAEYFWANLIFWAFLGLVVMFVWGSAMDPKDEPAITQVLSDTRKFILLLFGGGFTLVTLFDLAYDFFASRAGQQGEGSDGATSAG